MYKAGHVGVSLLVFLPVGAVLVLLGRPELAFLGEAVVLALASLPDVDHQVPLVSHRGITHTVWFALLVGTALGAVGWVLGGRPATPTDAELAVAGFAFGTLGIVAHLLGDVLTPMGIRPFWPFSRRSYTLRFVRANNTLANYGLLAAGAAATVGALLLVTGGTA